MGFTREQLKAYEGRTVPDLLGPGTSLLFVGINPGLWTAATQTHFCHPSNRFYPALRRSGLIDIDLDTSVGMTDAQRRQFLAGRLGITNLVARATARASELDPEELRTGGDRLHSVVGEIGPHVVAVAGVGAYRVAFDRPEATLGKQATTIGESEMWVVPNPSGLNAHATIDSLADWFRLVGDAAGLL